MSTDRRSGSRLRSLIAVLLFCAAAFAAAAYLHLHLPNIPDRDALYHFAQARVYHEQGILTHEFPWFAYSAIGLQGADIWYGYHLLLIPFTLWDDPVRGVKLAGVFELGMLLILFYLALRKAAIRWPFLWPFLLVTFSPFLLYRLIMTRPHVISMGLAACLLSAAVMGGPLAVGIVCFAIAFIHLSFFWVIPVVLVTVGLVKRRTEGSFEWAKGAAALIGGLLGWLLRPNPIGAAKLVYVQIVQLSVEKFRGVELAFGADLLSGVETFNAYPGEAAAHFIPCLLLWTGAASVFLAALSHEAELPVRARTLLWSILPLCVLYLVMTVEMSIRAIDLWSTFAVIFVAAVFTWIARPRAAVATGYATSRQMAVVAALGGLLSAIIIAHALYGHAGKMPRFGYPPHRMECAAQWLRENAEPGEIVFHTHWDLFPELVFWNPANRYIGGMDPIFQYAYDPALYWKAHHIYERRAGAYTSGTPALSRAEGEDIYTVLRRDFASSYVVLEQRRHAALYHHAQSDPRFRTAFEDAEVSVFELLDADE